MIGGRTVDVRTVVASSSPFILNATLNKHLNQYNDPVGKDVRKNIYVEDLISGVQHEEEAATYYNRARTLMSPVDFNLRSWTSNNPVIQSLAAKEYLLCDRPETKVLGVLWNTTTDMINYPPMRFTASTIPNLINKRECSMGRSSDPRPPNEVERVDHGIWDDHVHSDFSVVLPVGRTSPNDVELHVFLNECTKAYGTFAYVDSTQENHSSFVMAKSRIGPTKELTLPQLELTAAVIGTRLASYLQDEIHLNKVYLWLIDSQIV